VEVYVKCIVTLIFGDLGGKIEGTHLRLQLANLSQCLLLDKTLYTLIRRLYRKIIAERSYTR